MPVSSRPGVSGFDATKYPNRVSIEGAGIASSATAAAWTTIWNATGRGFLDRALVGDHGLSNTYGIRITIDGTKVFDGNIVGNANANCAGVVQENELAMSSTSINSRIYARLGTGAFNIATTLRQLPYTGGAVGICILYAPILFNTSVLVEVNCSAASGLMDYSVGGGLQ